MWPVVWQGVSRAFTVNFPSCKKDDDETDPPPLYGTTQCNYCLCLKNWYGRAVRILRFFLAQVLFMFGYTSGLKIRYASSKWSGNETVQMVWEWDCAGGLGMRLYMSNTVLKHTMVLSYLELVTMLYSLVHGSNPVIIPTHCQPLHHWHQLLVPTSMVP